MDRVHVMHTHIKQRNTRKLWEVLDMFNTLIVVMIPWVFACAQTYQIVYTKCAQFFVYQLYPNKTVKNITWKICLFLINFY